MNKLKTIIKQPWLWAALASVALSFALYGNSIPGDFVYDDLFYVNIQEFRRPETLWKLWGGLHEDLNGIYRPLTDFSFNANFLLFGDSPASFHVVNIILNGLVVFLVFVLAEKMFKSRALAVCAALIFAFLPIHTEAVASIKARDEILGALFGILSWLAFLAATEDRDKINFRKVWLSGILFLLAILSKEFMVALPALLLLSLCIRRKPSFWGLAKAAAIFFGILFSYLAWRYYILGPFASGSGVLPFIVNPLAYADSGTRIWTAFKIAFVYISKTFVPWNLSATYNYNHLTLVNSVFQSWQAAAGGVFLALLGILAVSKKFRHLPAGIGALAFLVPYAIISKFVFKGGDLLAERWMYFPSAGLSIIGGYCAHLLYRRQKWLGILVVAAVLGLYASVTIPRNAVWLTQERLFKSMVTDAPNSAQGHISLARWYLNAGLWEDAKKEAEIAWAIDQTHKEPRGHAVLFNTIGLVAYREGDYAKAEKAFLEEIRMLPSRPRGYQDLVKVYYAKGDYNKAKEILEYLIAAGSGPRPEDYIDYAMVLAKLGRYQESIEVIANHLLEKVGNPKIRMILAIDYFRMEKPEEAKKYFIWDNPSLTEEEKARLIKEFEEF